MSSGDSAELRMLRAKAYGPHGALSTEELARLRELEGLRLAPLAQPVSSPAASLPPLNDPHAPLPALNDPPVEPTPIPEPVEGSGVPVSDASTGSAIEAAPRRRRWPRLLTAAAVLVAIGIGVGWGIWGWDSEATALAAAHGDTLAELEAEEMYDSGTVTAVAEKHGMVIWRADRSDGDQLCVIVTGPKEPRHGCVTKDDLKNSVWPNVSATVPDGEEKAGQQLTAGLIPTATGELVPFVQVWDQNQSNWESQYNESELGQLRAVEAAGHMGTALSILGYDGGVVIWATMETGVLCVIAPTDSDGDSDGFAEGCAEDSETPISFEADVDGIRTQYVVIQSDRRQPQLTIYKADK